MTYIIPLLTIAVIWLIYRDLKKPAKPSLNLHVPSYNLALRDAGEILRDIRVELGVPVGEHEVIEEALDRIRKCFK